MVSMMGIIIIDVPIQNNSGMIFVLTFTIPIYTSPIHQLVTPEHILMGFQQLKNTIITNFKQICHRNFSFLPVER